MTVEGLIIPYERGRGYNVRTDATLSVLVMALQNNCGDLFRACQLAGVSLLFVQKWCKDDTDVATAIDEAERVGAMALQSAAIQRAVHGVEKGVYFKGERVDTEIQYSDGLLTRLMEAKIPLFSKKEDAGGATFNGPTQINIMPRAKDYDEWLNMKNSTIQSNATRDARDANAAALPAPEPALIDVTPEAKAAYRLMAPPEAAPFSDLGL